jgi:hypothetical protein
METHLVHGHHSLWVHTIRRENLMTMGPLKTAMRLEHTNGQLGKRDVFRVLMQ